MPKHSQCGIAPLKIPHIFIKYFCRKLAVLTLCAHVVLVSHLQDDFMERLFLFAGTYLFIVILNLAVCPGLPVIVPLEGLVKKLMENCLDIFVAVGYIQVGAFRVGVLGVERPAVVVHRALPHHRTNRPFQINTPFAAPAAAFVTFCESNAKALLTALRPSKAHLRPTGWSGGVAPAVCGRLPQQGRPLKRAPCTPPKL